MNIEEKCVKRLEDLDIPATLENGTVYIYIGDTMLELSEFEIRFQSEQYDKQPLN